MLFDLRGKRRRTVQATYLTLAVLMGAGLVLFGIGSSTNGGLGDLFKSGNGSNKGNDVAQKQIDAAQRVLLRDPKNAAALGQLIKGHYTLATAQADQNGNFLPKAGPELQKATAAWERYLATNPPKPDLTATRYAVQAYSGLARLQTGAAQKSDFAGLADAYGAVAESQPSLQAYVTVAQYANAAGKTTIAARATARALALAPKKQRKQVTAATSQPPPEAQPAQAQPQPVPGTGGK